MSGEGPSPGRRDIPRPRDIGHNRPRIGRGGAETGGKGGGIGGGESVYHGPDRGHPFEETDVVGRHPSGPPPIGAAMSGRLEVLEDPLDPRGRRPDVAGELRGGRPDPGRRDPAPHVMDDLGGLGRHRLEGSPRQEPVPAGPRPELTAPVAPSPVAALPTAGRLRGQPADGRNARPATRDATRDLSTPPRGGKPAA